MRESPFHINDCALLYAVKYEHKTYGRDSNCVELVWLVEHMDELLDEMHRLLVALRTNEKDLRSEVNAIQRILWDAHYSELAEHVSTLARIQQEAED